MLVVVLFGAFAFTSCGDDDENDDSVNPLIGSWVREDTSVSSAKPGDGLFSALTFKSDGTYIQTWIDCMAGKITRESHYGKCMYRINNGELTMLSSEGGEGASDIYINVNKKSFPDYVKESLNYE